MCVHVCVCVWTPYKKICITQMRNNKQQKIIYFIVCRKFVVVAPIFFLLSN